MIGVYKITNKANGKIYIGKAQNIFRRWCEHEKQLENGTHHNYRLQVDFDTSKKISDFVFEIVEICKADELNNLEEKYIAQYNVLVDGYNIRDDVGIIKKQQKLEPIKCLNMLNNFMLMIDWCDVKVDIGKYTDKFIKGGYSGITYNKYSTLLEYITKNRDLFIKCNSITIKRSVDGIAAIACLYGNNKEKEITYYNRTIYTKTTCFSEKREMVDDVVIEKTDFNGMVYIQ